MKSRQEIKAIAKEAMARQRGAAILIILAVALVSSAGALFARIPIIGSLFSLAISFITMALSVSVNSSFIRVYCGEKSSVGDTFSGLAVNFFRKVGGMYWMSLWIFLWSMLLVVPGVIKSLAYSMTPYILADCPEVNATDALKLSMRMTDGHKGELFVFALSWIGWGLLIPVTFGILGIVHVIPYYSTAMAGYYIELRDLAIDSGMILPEELGYAYEEVAD